jgi:hypothetical protein
MREIDTAISHAKFRAKRAGHSDNIQEMERQEWLLSKLELAKRLIDELGFTDFPYLRDSLRYEHELNELHCDGLVILRNATFEGIQAIVMEFENC